MVIVDVRYNNIGVNANLKHSQCKYSFAALSSFNFKVLIQKLVCLHFFFSDEKWLAGFLSLFVGLSCLSLSDSYLVHLHRPVLTEVRPTFVSYQ